MIYPVILSGGSGTRLWPMSRSLYPKQLLALFGDTVFVWEPHDIFVVPSWMTHTHRATSEAVLFSFSDRVVQEKLGLWRETRGNA